jgi:ribonucleoside-diphosphate reductase alpha chain
MEHLNSLATVARNTSLSVSKTINLDATATKEEIAEVYLKAYELGIIGVTVYRDGCRDGVLIHNVKDNKAQIVKNNAPKRPKKLPCHVYRVSILNRVSNEAEKWIIFVGLLNEDPYEIIAGKINGTDFSHDVTEGEMVKIKREGKSVYQFVSNNEVLVDDVKGAYLNGLREYTTRLMSWGLRHGGGIEYLKEVLQKSDGTIVDFNKAIIRAISRYVKDVKSKEKCPTCNADLKYVEGCVKCSDPECSFSKCGG